MFKAVASVVRSSFLSSVCFGAFAMSLAPVLAAAEFTQHKLLADDGRAEDYFSFSTAIDGDTALVGAFKADGEPNRADAGAAYIFKLGAEGWQQQAKLVAADGKAGDTLGGNVALAGDLAALGVIGHDALGDKSGAVYVFKRSGSHWAQQAKILPADGSAGDAFGQSIAIKGRTMIIGAPHDSDHGKSSGSVYVFGFSQGRWEQQAKLLAPDGAAGDVFGISVAISGDTLLVGADLHDEQANNAGAAYVYTRNAGAWQLQQKLMASDGGDTDLFGVRVALSGDTALISARRDDDEQMGIDSGSAYVFIRKGGQWQQQAKLTAADGSADDRFGRAVALEGETAVISAMHQDDKGEKSGAVYVFTRKAQTWSQVNKFAAKDGAPGDVFGWSVAFSQGRAIVGAARDDDKGENSGSAYIVDLNAH